jgi:hypothetical protein
MKKGKDGRKKVEEGRKGRRTYVLRALMVSLRDKCSNLNGWKEGRKEGKMVEQKGGRGVKEGR